MCAIDEIACTERVCEEMKFCSFDIKEIFVLNRMVTMVSCQKKSDTLMTDIYIITFLLRARILCFCMYKLILHLK